MPLHLKGANIRLGSLDPHSFAEFESAVVTHLDVRLRLDFNDQRISQATAKVHVKRLGGSGGNVEYGDRVRLDIISSLVCVEDITTVDGQPARYEVGSQVSPFGDSLDIWFPETCKDSSVVFVVKYYTRRSPGGAGGSSKTTEQHANGSASEVLPSPAAPTGQRLDFDKALAPSANGTPTSSSSSSTTSAVQWLRASQTLGKKCPLVFSQAQAILARSFVPCQDSPAVKHTFSFALEVETPLVAVCSGELVGIEEVAAEDVGGSEKKGLDPEAVFGNTDDQNAITSAKTPSTSSKPPRKTYRAFHYKQDIPVPAYLLAFVAGRLGRAKIGAKSYVYAEPELLEKATKELSGVCDKYLAVAEKDVLLGSPYVWGSFNVAVMPNSFGFGGMENPNVTFFSGSLLAGDQSLTTTLAHEITHSWTGNLVTNKYHKDFWLNEGFTRYVERRILGVCFGEDFRELCLEVGYNDLLKNVKLMQDNGQGRFTALEPDLVGVDPDEAFSRVPYEKGSLFLLFLEIEIVKSKTRMSEWLYKYLEDFGRSSLETADMRRHFVEFFPESEGQIDWDLWLHGEGLPSWRPPTSGHQENKFLSAIAVCHGKIRSRDSSNTTSIQDWKAQQIMVLLDRVIEDGSITKNADLIRFMSQHNLGYDFETSSNVEILFRWILLRIRAASAPTVEVGEDSALLSLLDTFLGTHGRGSYVKPIYLTLKNTGRVDVARQLFEKHCGFYQDTIANVIRKALK
ncbi:unnamed protein product [Amoebophrya sp. A25]|nr:unnamed protein product [Amoebophrya sp. A25]|eukprot:GSA25T00003397001.1